MKCELADPDGLVKQLKILKSIHVDGVMVDCWWGIVEAHAPQEYNWNGYKRLFQIVREMKMKLQVTLHIIDCLAFSSNIYQNPSCTCIYLMTILFYHNARILFLELMKVWRQFISFFFYVKKGLNEYG